MLVTLRWSVRPNVYHDSVKLMRVSQALAAEPGVKRAAAVMGTQLNIELLGADSLLPDGLSISPDDLVITVDGETAEAADAALARIDTLLAPRIEEHAERVQPPRTIESTAGTGGRMAVIAVPGRFASAEAYAALDAGMHVFLFSDNVSVDDEVRLKRLAAERNLLMMGPDCGTAIIGGIGLGFANRVDRGPIGIVGASGTGIQQVCCLLDSASVGVAQAIGTGGRDLSSAVGGSMTMRGLHLLEDDPDVRVIVVISKPADAEVASRLHDAMSVLQKPVVACLLGSVHPREGSVRYASTLLDAARYACKLVGYDAMSDGDQTPTSHLTTKSGRRVYGLFAGGTLCSEARQILDRLHTPHKLVDLGDDDYTRGRAHPIIDPRLRVSMIEALATHDDLGAVLIDVILGDLADPDPAGSLLPALNALHRRRGVPVVVTLIGTRRDPQGLGQQMSAFRDAGALVFSANVLAAEAAARLVGGSS